MAATQKSAKAGTGKKVQSDPPSSAITASAPEHPAVDLPSTGLSSKLDDFSRLYGKPVEGDYKLSCNLKDLQLQYRQPTLLVGVPKGGVEIRAWTDRQQEPKQRAVLPVGDVDDKNKTAQLVKWGTGEELDSFKKAVDATAGKHVLLVHPIFRKTNYRRIDTITLPFDLLVENDTTLLLVDEPYKFEPMRLKVTKICDAMGGKVPVCIRGLVVTFVVETPTSAVLMDAKGIKAVQDLRPGSAVEAYDVMAHTDIFRWMDNSPNIRNVVKFVGIFSEVNTSEFAYKCPNKPSCSSFGKDDLSQDPITGLWSCSKCGLKGMGTPFHHCDASYMSFAVVAADAIANFMCHANLNDPCLFIQGFTAGYGPHSKRLASAQAIHIHNDDDLTADVEHMDLEQLLLNLDTAAEMHGVPLPNHDFRRRAAAHGGFDP
ncbi:hypothetical protein WJX84_005798 [Apatococcus fuscideae]|uniref:Uncharacterized protein n=1 Tax=Apatococcus fuscideae TaxID=2026836 RepID=A0AAW1T106_9CHLO